MNISTSENTILGMDEIIVEAMANVASLLLCDNALKIIVNDTEDAQQLLEALRSIDWTLEVKFEVTHENKGLFLIDEVTDLREALLAVYNDLSIRHVPFVSSIVEIIVAKHFSIPILLEVVNP